MLPWTRATQREEWRVKAYLIWSVTANMKLPSAATVLLTQVSVRFEFSQIPLYFEWIRFDIIGIFMLKLKNVSERLLDVYQNIEYNYII